MFVTRNNEYINCLKRASMATKYSNNKYNKGKVIPVTVRGGP
jgi:hypothetical protein